MKMIMVRHLDAEGVIVGEMAVLTELPILLEEGETVVVGKRKIKKSLVKTTLVFTSDFTVFAFEGYASLNKILKEPEEPSDFLESPSDDRRKFKTWREALAAGFPGAQYDEKGGVWRPLVWGTRSP